MYKLKTFFFCLSALIILIPLSTNAQLSKSSTPISFSQNLKSTVQTITTETVNVSQLLLEDEEEEKQGMPQRFGYPFDVNYDLTNSGNWQTFPDGSKMWRLRIESPDAYSINLLYDDFHLPEDAELFLYNDAKTSVIGAFTSRNNKPHRKFATAPVQGEAITLELNVPSDVNEECVISISRITHAYRDLFKIGEKNFGSSGSCNNNVNCSEGDPWRDEINSVAMILLGDGFRWCSGSMINNVRQDLVPYFLTADHCLNSPETFIFMFNYQSPTCANINGPTTMTLQGSTLLANNGTSDFALLLLDETPPDSFDIFYSGWSNINTAAPSTVGIHHPAGDIKKISFNDNSVTSTSYYGTSSGNGSHWRVDDWEDGTTEGGSSGSPLFDQNHHIIGQLHGGNASCGSITDDWYGKFATSWDGSSPSRRLRDWLDPDSTGATTLDGIASNGLLFSADTVAGWVPLDVQFSATSIFPIDTWSWDFGDGGFDSNQNPLYTYTTPGAYNVRLDVVSGGEPSFRLKNNYIIALADTLSESDIESPPDSDIEVIISAENNIPLKKFILPIEYDGNLQLTYDSFSTAGCRTDYFEQSGLLNVDQWNRRVVIQLISSSSNSLLDLPVGAGPIVKIYFHVDAGATASDTTIIHLDGYNTYLPTFSSSLLEYQPALIPGIITIPSSCCVGIRGNIDNDPGEIIDISDLVFLVDFMFTSGAEPACLPEGNVDGDALEVIDISDLVYMVDFLFNSGANPANCF